MRTYSTIISLIFMLACANATKSVTYSDIVYSLMELNQDPNAQKHLENLKQINDSFAESKEKLKKWDAIVQERCAKIQAIGVRQVQDKNDELITLQKTKTENLEKQANVRRANEAAQTLLSENKKEIKDLQNKIKEERAGFAESEKKRAEKLLIYKRLKNFVQDELSGTQRNTVMGTINVDRSFSGKTSFVQLERIRSDLTDISAKTSDTIVKSMITTLIAITQSADKSLFASPAIVQKIRSLIDLLIQKEKDANQVDSEVFNKNLSNYSNLISSKTDEAERKGNEVLQLKAELAALEQDIRNNDNEVTVITKFQQKLVKKNRVQQEICAKQNELVNVHNRDFDSFKSHFQILASDMA